MTFTATAQPANIPPRVSLSVTGLTDPTTVTVLRLDPDGRNRPVRGADPAPSVGGTWSDYDYEAPFGVPVIYSVSPLVGSAQTASAVTLDATNIWLIHPGLPDLSVTFAADDVSVVEARTRPARSALHQPQGRVTPVAVSEARGTPQTGITVMTDTLDRRAALWALLDGGVPILVNIPPALGWGVDPEWALVGDVDETPWNRGLSIARVFTMPYQVVDRPVGGIAAQWTWAGLAADTTHPTWADVIAAYPTWSDLIANSPLT